MQVGQRPTYFEEDVTGLTMLYMTNYTHFIKMYKD